VQTNHFVFAVAKVLLFCEPPKLLSTFLLKSSKKSRYLAVNRIKTATFAPNNTLLLLMEQTNLLVDTIIKGIQEKKGTDIVVADLNGIDGTICRYFVVCQGNSPTQVDAIVDSIADMAREQQGEKPAHIVGRENAQWVAMDYGDILVHVFLPDVRQYYDLEHLWADAKLNVIPNLD
jgi:ribosome-associated protein